MSHFIYKAKKPDGEIYTGERDAADRFALYKMIRDGGEEIVTFSERKSKMRFGGSNFLSGIWGRIKTVEKIHLIRNLGSMLEAGLTLTKSLSVLGRQTRNKKLKKVLAGVVDDITKGSTFSGALEKHKNVFSPLVISISTGSNSPL